MSGGNFSVGVTIHLVDKFSHGLMGLSHVLGKAHGDSEKFKQKLAEVHAQVMKFGMIESVGKNMFASATSALHSMLEPAKEYSHLLNIMNMQGMKQVEIQENIKTAWATSGKMPVSSPTENLKALLDLSNFFVDSKLSYHEARALLPSFIKAKTIMAGSAEKYGMDPSEQVYAMAKAVEMIGKVNKPEEFEHEMDMMNRVAVATAGRVMPSHYQNTFKYARQAKLTMDDDFKYKVLPELIMEMQSGGGGAGGGGGPGAMIAAATRLGVQGIMSVATAGNLAKLGLLDAPVLKTTTTGTQVKGGAGLIHSDEFAANSQKWVEKYMIPAMIKQNPDLKDDPAALLLAIAQTIKGNQNAIALIQELHQKTPQIGRFGMRLDAVPSSDKLYDAALKDPGVVESAFEKSMETLKTSIATNVMPVIIPAVYEMAKAINVVAQFFRENPIYGQLIMAAMAATAFVGGIMALVGSFGIMIAVVSLLGVSIAAATAIVLGSIAVVTGIVMALLNFDRVGKALNRVMSQGIIIFLQVQNAFARMMMGIMNVMYGALGQLNGLMKAASFGALNIDGIMAGQGENQAWWKGVLDENHAKINAQKANMAMRPQDALNKPRSIDLSGTHAPANNHNTQVNIANMNVHSPDPHKAAHDVSKNLNGKIRQAVRSVPGSGGTYHSSGHAGAHG